MEQKTHHEEAPTMSIVEKKKLEASEYVKAKIEELQNEDKSKLEAAKIVYDIVKGHEFRQEQALAKLLEFFNLQEEIKHRAIEIGIDYPAFSGLVGTAEGSSNDKKFMVAA